MPRTNLDHHLKNHRASRDAILESPAAQKVLGKIVESLGPNDSIGARELAGIINVPRDLLCRQELARPSAGQMFSAEQARDLADAYLPRALGWKSVAVCAEENQIHTNHVVSILATHNFRSELLIAADHRQYVSPRGDQLVSDVVRDMNSRFRGWLTPKKLADECGVKLNVVTAYFCAKNEKFEKDAIGHPRVSPDQTRRFRNWRAKRAMASDLPDREIGGVPHRSLKRAAADRAELYVPEKGRQRDAALQRCEHSLRHRCKQAGVLQDTDLGPYLPREFGEKFRLRITLADAARLIGVTSSAIKHWRSGNPSLKAATLPGCESLDVDLPKLVEFAAEKYLTGAKFVKAGDVPSYIAYFQIRFLAERLHLDWRGLMDGIVTDAQTRALLLQPLSKLPQQVFRELQEHVKPFRNYAPSLTREGNFPPIYYSRLSESFYIGRKIVPAAAMIRLIQGCAAKTSHSPAYLYGLVRTLCKPAHLYPADFDSFKHRQQSIVGVTAFPLAAAVFLETVTTGEGICYYSTKLPKNVYNGDFIIFPDEHDFWSSDTGSGFRSGSCCYC